MQQVLALAEGDIVAMHLPDPSDEVVPKVRWGRFEDALTPAFWAAQAWMDPESKAGVFALGRSLVEELVACLLGGHGARAEVGLAAFDRVVGHIRENGPVLSERVATDLLTEPLTVKGVKVRYRFARQRAKYLAGCLEGLAAIDEHRLGDIELREILCTLPGIGPKTASWIVRNRRGSDHVAILDVHIMRACVYMGVFEPDATPTHGYRELEHRFINFCHAVGVRPSVMDAVMWRTMRSVGPIFMRMLLAQQNPSHNPSATKLGGAEGCQEAAVVTEMT